MLIESLFAEHCYNAEISTHGWNRDELDGGGWVLMLSPKETNDGKVPFPALEWEIPTETGWVEFGNFIDARIGRAQYMNNFHTTGMTPYISHDTHERRDYGEFQTLQTFAEQKRLPLIVMRSAQWLEGKVTLTVFRPAPLVEDAKHDRVAYLYVDFEAYYPDHPRAIFAGLSDENFDALSKGWGTRDKAAENFHRAEDRDVETGYVFAWKPMSESSNWRREFQVPGDPACLLGESARIVHPRYKNVAVLVCNLSLCGDTLGGGENAHIWEMGSNTAGAELELWREGAGKNGWERSRYYTSDADLKAAAVERCKTGGWACDDDDAAIDTVVAAISERVASRSEGSGWDVFQGAA